jgi:exonuclease III
LVAYFSASYLKIRWKISLHPDSLGMQEIVMQESSFPQELEHLRANLSVLISQGMTSAYGVSLLAQACQFPNERELLAFTAVQAHAHHAMAWQRRIEDLAKQHRGPALVAALDGELDEANSQVESVFEAYIIGLVHDELHRDPSAA